MKAPTKLSLIALLVFAVVCPAVADTDIGVFGQVRLRLEADQRGFDNSAAVLNQADMRTRMVLEAIVDGNAHTLIQFQDSRRAGEDGLSGTLNHGKIGDVHQAYLKLDNLFGKGWGAKGGKFEFALGNERVFGPVDWHNVGRSWQGLMLWYDHAKANIMPFWLKRVELNDSSYNRDFDIFGIAANIKNLNWELFATYEYNADSTDLTTNKLDRISMGTYYKRKYDQFDFELNGAFQLGNSASPDTADDTTINTIELDISAYMFTFEVGYSVPGAANARVAAGIDYTSGDSDENDNKDKTYDNLYYTDHNSRGYMDYFTKSRLTGKDYENAGLMDLMLRGKLDPITGWTVKGDLHYFSTAQDYLSLLDSSLTKDIGLELDLTVSTTRVAGVNLTAGVSMFLPTKAFAGMTDPDPGFWGYSMATVDF